MSCSRGVGGYLSAARYRCAAAGRTRLCKGARCAGTSKGPLCVWGGEGGGGWRPGTPGPGLSCLFLFLLDGTVLQPGVASGLLSAVTSSGGEREDIAEPAGKRRLPCSTCCCWLASTSAPSLTGVLVHAAASPLVWCRPGTRPSTADPLVAPAVVGWAACTTPAGGSVVFRQGFSVPVGKDAGSVER